jgi:translation initiation factor RLI1
MLTEKELSNYFDSLPEDKRDGLTKAQFINECKRILSPKNNTGILKQMVQIRHKERTARHNKAVADRALERSRLGIR